MAVLTSEELAQAAANIDALSPSEQFAHEVENRIHNLHEFRYGWHEFYPSGSIPREDLDNLADKIAEQAGHIIEIKSAHEPLILRFLRRLYGPKEAPLVFRVHLSPPRDTPAE